MVQISCPGPARRCLRIVVRGPCDANKRAFLEHLHRKSGAFSRQRSELRRQRVCGNDWLGFEISPDGVECAGSPVLLRVECATGGLTHSDVSRRFFLRGADGVILLTDSWPERDLESIESMLQLQDDLEQCGTDPRTFPVAFLWDRGYARSRLPLATLLRVASRGDLLLQGPTYTGDVARGEGVIVAMQALLHRVNEAAEARRPGQQRVAQESPPAWIGRQALKTIVAAGLIYALAAALLS